MYRTLAQNPRLVNIVEITAPRSPKPCVLTSGVTAPLHFIAYDHCDGGDLFGYISKVPLEPFEEAVNAYIFRQLLEALSFLHGRNLFHRGAQTL